MVKAQSTFPMKPAFPVFYFAIRVPVFLQGTLLCSCALLQRVLHTVLGVKVWISSSRPWGLLSEDSPHLLPEIIPKNLVETASLLNIPAPAILYPQLPRESPMEGISSTKSSCVRSQEHTSILVLHVLYIMAQHSTALCTVLFDSASCTGGTLPLTL